MEKREKLRHIMKHEWSQHNIVLQMGGKVGRDLIHWEQQQKKVNFKKTVGQEGQL